MTPPTDAHLTREARAKAIADDWVWGHADHECGYYLDKDSCRACATAAATLTQAILAALRATEQETWEAAAQMVRAIADAPADSPDSWMGLTTLEARLRARAAERGESEAQR